MKTSALLVIPVLLIACQPATSPVELPMMGGYRDAADQCRRVGESAYTNQFLDDAADLVGCPADYEGNGVFVTDTGAREVDRVGDVILFSVPVR